MSDRFKTIANTPLGTVIKVALVILGVEFLIMLAIEAGFRPVFGHQVSPVFWEFLDPILLTAIVSPALYFFVLRPMKEQQLKLEQQKDELGIAAVTFNSKDAVIVTDANHKILKVNRSFTIVTGYTSEDAVGKTPAILQSGRQDNNFYRQMRESLDHNNYWQGEIWSSRKNGEVYPEWLTISSVKGEKGHKYYVGIFSDITQRKASEEKINFLAFHDRLTSLPNRELFYDRLSRAISLVRRKQYRLALLYIDLDGFKAVNDTYGHKTGDEVLRTTAHRLMSCVRDVDTVARLGGDEFAVVLGEIEKSGDAISVVENIIEKLSYPISLQDGNACVIGASIGIAIYPENGTEIDRLMSAADNAMYESKALGRNIYTFYRNDADQNAENQPWIILDAGHFPGIPEYDQQHQELVSTLNKLNAAVKHNEPSELIIRVFDEFIAQIVSHFESEDHLIDRYGYSDNNLHKIEHQHLLREVVHLKEKIKHGGELVVLQYFKDWLLNHVQVMDKHLAEFIVRRNVK